MLQSENRSKIPSNSSTRTLLLLYENGRPITLLAPVIIITIYMFHFSTIFSFSTVINYLMILVGVISLRLGINNVNNSEDLAADLINKPHRPIPRGDLPLDSAYIIGIVLQFISVFIFMLLSLEAFLLNLSFVVIAWWYNRPHGLKDYFPINNLVIGYVRGFGYLLVPFSLGILVTPVMWIHAIAITLFIFGAVNSKDIKDVEGDKEMNRITLPIILDNRQELLPLLSSPFVLAPVIIYTSIVITAVVSPLYLLFLILLPLDIIILYFMKKASTTHLTENTTAWMVMIITYLGHHLVFFTILQLL